MQNGSVIRAERQRGPDVWEFRWREPGADGKRKHRRMILRSIEQLAVWILPRWGKYSLARVNAGEVELWLRSLLLASQAARRSEIS
jgi:hypothetical protein